MAGGPVSPSTANLTVLKATISFAGTALGEVESCTLSPDNSNLDYISSMSGIGTVTKSVTTSRKLNIAMTMAEFSEFNVRLALMAPASGAISIYSQAQREGAVVITGTNDIGQKFTCTLPSVSLLPAGDFEFIGGDDWSKMQVEGSVNAIAGVFGTLTRTGGETDPDA